MFRLFIDEFGHHDMKSSADPNQRYLGLTGVIMRRSYAEGSFAEALGEIKERIFGRSNFALHRSEILAARSAPYTVLVDRSVRTNFDAAILNLIETSIYRVVTVIIDKKEHRTKYTVWQFQPYHYCMTALLERYIRWLQSAKDVGDVMAEARGKKEDKQLAKAYQFLYRYGTDNVPAALFQQWLSSKEIKFKRKADNVAGLQMADLLANPSCRELICNHSKAPMTAEFSRKVVEILYRKKYRRNPFDGTVQGWGTKWLP